MNSQELLRHLVWIPGHTVGVFPADQIPKVWTKPTAFIFNTQSHKLPGAHWVCIHVDRHGDGWYFDSYGIPPYVPDHINRLRKNCKRIHWNVKQLQSETSNVCGQYCLTFLYYMSTGLGVSKFHDLFTADLQKNDTTVRNFISHRGGDKLYFGRGVSNGYISNIRCLQNSNSRMSLI